MEKSKYKSLAIFSDCIHLNDADGNAATENHIFRKQMETLAAGFERTIIYCPFVDFTNEKVVTAYKKNGIQFRSLPNAGGNTLADKINIFFTIPIWLKAAMEADKKADVIYQRFPANLNIPAFFYFFFKRKKVFATYAGSWDNYKGEPLTYRFQKWLLNHFFRGPVFAYLHQNKIGTNIFKTYSPSYTIAEWNEEAAQINARIERLKLNKDLTPVFVTVGSLVPKKNQQYILDSFKILFDNGFNFRLYIVGNGFLKNSYRQFIEKNNLGNNIFLTGNKTDTGLRELYRQADFVVQASLSEGFGKVPLEGFFHGVIPILNNIGLAAEMMGKEERGFLFNVANSNALVEIISSLELDRERLSKMIINGRNYSSALTLESWAGNSIKVLNNYFA